MMILVMVFQDMLLVVFVVLSSVRAAAFLIFLTASAVRFARLIGICYSPTFHLLDVLFWVFPIIFSCLYPFIRYELFLVGLEVTALIALLGAKLTFAAMH